MRKNLTQEVAGAFFGVSQPTVSRRWDLLRPAIGAALAGCVPDPREILGNGTALVDGTVAPTWDWAAIPDLFSGKAGYPGMNIQVAAGLDGRVAAIGPVPVHGARHDAHAFEASGLKDLLAGHDDGRGPRLHRRGWHPHRPVQDAARRACMIPRPPSTTTLSKIRAAVEHAIAHVKTWRMLSEEGGRYRRPSANTADAPRRHRVVLLQQLLQPL